MASSDASSSSASMRVTLTYRTDSHSVELEPDTSVDAIRDIVYDVFHVHPKRQKLLPKPRPARPIPPHSTEEEGHEITTLADLGLKEGTSTAILVLGPQDDELQRMQAREEEKRRHEAPRQYHPSMLRGGKLRNTTKPAAASPFASIQVHPATPPSSPEHAKMKAYLTRLATDPGVLHVCALHDYRVGVLTELLPHEHPELLGLNENSGQRISLRIRTDRYDGTRDYSTVRRVLLHELAHNDVHDHPPEFKTLNSLLNAQLLEFEGSHRRADRAARSINSSELDMPVAEAWEPEEDATAASVAASHVLGGGSTAAGGDTPEQKRARILQALEARLAPLEAEIRRGCGGTKDNDNSGGSADDVH